MSNHTNYNKMFDTDEPVVEPKVDEAETAVVKQEVEETESAAPEFATGVVVDCVKLNVREQPSKDAEVVCIIPAGTEVQVTNSENEDWLYVCTAAGLEGFCMKQFISVK